MLSREGRTFAKYLVVQVPGWVLMFLLLGFLRSRAGLALWIAVAVMAAWVVKDLLLYRFLKAAYSADPSPAGAERLVGTRGVVTSMLSPQGYVRVRGELWRAETLTADAVPEGTRVTVSAASGLMLTVEREPRHADGHAS